jgi:hypothetical protein
MGAVCRNLALLTAAIVRGKLEGASFLRLGAKKAGRGGLLAQRDSSSRTGGVWRTLPDDLGQAWAWRA